MIGCASNLTFFGEDADDINGLSSAPAEDGAKMGLDSASIWIGSDVLLGRTHVLTSSSEGIKGIAAAGGPSVVQPAFLRVTDVASPSVDSGHVQRSSFVLSASKARPQQPMAARVLSRLHVMTMFTGTMSERLGVGKVASLALLELNRVLEKHQQEGVLPNPKACQP